LNSFGKTDGNIKKTKGETMMKKFIPALCMLMIAAALLGTSTFAWFSMNTQVEATGLSVEATASKNLLISNTSDTEGFSGNVTLGVSATELEPVSTIGNDKATPDFYKLKTAGDEMSQDSYAAANSKMEAATADDYAKTTVWLKCVGEAGANLKLDTDALTGGDKDLARALRVMLVDKTNTKTYIYYPVTGAAYGTTGQAVASLSSEEAVLGAVKTLADDTTVLLATMTADTAYAFDVYVWYEGEDVNCKAANTADMAATEIALAFSIAND
jgi:hypothetical protein